MDSANPDHALPLEPRSCPLCGPSAPKRTRYGARFRPEDFTGQAFAARKRPEGVHFQIVECGGCGMLFSDPACSPQLLAGLYERSPIDYQEQEAQIDEAYRPVLDRAVARLRHRGQFVEIGGGSGFMLRYGLEHGFASALEVEPSEAGERGFQARYAGRPARFLRAMFHEGLVPDGSSSVVCFFQTLDHVPDPLAFLRAVARCLEPGGVAVAVTHNTRAVSARLLGEKSPIIDLEHTFLYHPKNLAALFRKAGFAEVETFGIANAYAAKYWLNLAPLPAPLKSLLGGVLRVTGAGEWRIPLRAGNFAVVARIAESSVPPASAA